jgi:uncharacterized protein YjcR
MEHRFGPICVGQAERVQAMTRFEIDWHAIERDYVAGMLSLRKMATKHGCSHSAIVNRAGRHGWQRVPAPEARG